MCQSCLVLRRHTFSSRSDDDSGYDDEDVDNENGLMTLMLLPETVNVDEGNDYCCFSMTVTHSHAKRRALEDIW